MKALYIKISIILMFVTGLLQIAIFNISWEYFRLIQAVHIISSIVVSIIFVIPFVNKHTYEFMIVKKVNSKSAIVLGIIFFMITLSGFYLFLVGNQGGDELGIYSFNIHLYGSFVMLYFFFIHAKKRFDDKKATVVTIFIVMGLFSPAKSFSDITKKLTLMKLENNVSRYYNEDWTSSVKCKSCHEDIFKQWADSNHRHMAGTNPYYMVMENLASESEGEPFRQWCMGCHNPAAVTTERARTTHMMDGDNMPNILFEGGSKDLVDEFETHGNSRLEEGVSCLACHRITKVESKGNSSYTLDLTNRKKYVFEDSNSQTAHWLSEKFINSNPKTHKDSYLNPIYKKSAYCASCHDEFLPQSGLAVVSTFKEWEKSPFNNPKDKTKHKDCIDCHMTNLEDGKFSPLKGRSTTGGEIKNDVKVHYFSGSNHFLSGLKSEIHENQTIQLLKTAAKLDVEIINDKIIVGVKNEGAGHNLPTGVSDFRELWLDITLKDRDSNIVFSSGKLKDDGNLDGDARPFMKVFGDENNQPVGLFFWKYKRMISDTRIPSGERRVESYDIPDSKKLKYPLSIVVKLNFRIYPQWVTDAVRNAYPQLPNPPVIELEKITKEFSSKQ